MEKTPLSLVIGLGDFGEQVVRNVLSQSWGERNPWTKYIVIKNIFAETGKSFPKDRKKIFDAFYQYIDSIYDYFIKVVKSMCLVDSQVSTEVFLPPPKGVLNCYIIGSLSEEISAAIFIELAYLLHVITTQISSSLVLNFNICGHFVLPCSFEPSESEKPISIFSSLLELEYFLSPEKEFRFKKLEYDKFIDNKKVRPYNYCFFTPFLDTNHQCEIGQKIAKKIFFETQLSDVFNDLSSLRSNIDPYFFEKTSKGYRSFSVWELGTVDGGISDSDSNTQKQMFKLWDKVDPGKYIQRSNTSLNLRNYELAILVKKLKNTLSSCSDFENSICKFGALKTITTDKVSECHLIRELHTISLKDFSFYDVYKKVYDGSKNYCELFVYDEVAEFQRNQGD